MCKTKTITISEIAKLLGVTTVTVNNIRHAQHSTMPSPLPHIENDRLLYWEREAMLFWIEDRKKVEKPGLYADLAFNFITGKYDRKDQRLDYLKKKRLAKTFERKRSIKISLVDCWRK
jgi:transcriptional regulator with XRE-family HTH domain